ncbi:hypothetical protein [Microbacterium sp.]|uniref:hypothetical protein n=1 Tax=Microbacterium sp. TaxID=51671 RepID=UPI0025F05CEE|nr:hypothetical protein [Microbacterium sp.]MBT9605766.1 hypothetical protein [Microbacterium sp.]
MSLTSVEVGRCGGELFTNSVSLATECAEPLADTVAGQRGIRGEVEQVVFLGLQRREPVFELGASEMFGLRLITNGAFEVVSYNLYEFGAQLDLLVVLFDRGLNVVDVCEGCVAGAVLDAPTEEVPVFAPAPADASLLDQSPIRIALEAAVAAPDAAFEIVRVPAATLSRDTAGFQDSLYGVE